MTLIRGVILPRLSKSIWTSHLLQSRLREFDDALNDNTKLTGVFEALKQDFRFTGGRDLLDHVASINDFRNTRVAHQEQPLTDPAAAKPAVADWIAGLGRLWQVQQKSD